MLSVPTTREIRQTFLDYFWHQSHHIVSSASLIPHDDPSLMFTNAGMVPFKNFFTGVEQPAYPRVAGCQKCIRAGGKHNDLEQVGYTSRHHTFFEMLGNFSFQDYFKDQAITLAWELLTQVFELPKGRLLVTVHASDQESAKLWRGIAGLPEHKIISIGGSDNFWQMGDSGPCGPCSEIFYDHGEHLPGGPPGSPAQDGARFVEVWNLVFMQSELTLQGLRPLPQPSVDTGMGLERLAAIFQGKSDNYETDILGELVKGTIDCAGLNVSNHRELVAYKVIADHIRSISFLIADGMLPSNEGRGYILRRIMRRALRYAYELTQFSHPLLERVVGQLVELMGQDYPELVHHQSSIESAILLEKSRFHETLVLGLRSLDKQIESLSADQPLAGEVAFKLHDTYGFPLDLTVDILRSRGRSVDTTGFDQAMALQQRRAKQARGLRVDDRTANLWWDWQQSRRASEFMGYHTEQAWGEVLALGLLSGQGKDTCDAGNGSDSKSQSCEDEQWVEVRQAQVGDRIVLLASQTPFYAEAGGQLGDRGMVLDQADLRIRIEDTQKQGKDLIVHYGVIEQGSVQLGGQVSLVVDDCRRQATRASHSATHLLHQALREHLGDHIAQKGAMVGAGRVRFDFSHPRAVSRDDIRLLELRVNEHAWANTPVTTRVMSTSKALSSGARALFGEKYGDQVRVVTMGLGDGGKAYSAELCGGTHVSATGEIGLFRIVDEHALSSGVRRIEALVGLRALAHSNQRESVLYEVCGHLQVAPGDLPQRVAGLLKEQRRQQTTISQLRQQLAGQQTQWLDVGGIRFCGKLLEGVPPRELKSVAARLTEKVGSGIVALVGRDSAEDKASLVVAVTSDLTGHFNAVMLARQAAEQLGGRGGGGRPELAQSGGPYGAMAQSALDKIRQIIEVHSA